MKEKKWRRYKGKQYKHEKRDGSLIIIEVNVNQAIKSLKKSDVIVKSQKMMPLRSSTITIIRKVIISKIVPSQKTINNLGNLYVNNC